MGVGDSVKYLNLRFQHLVQKPEQWKERSQSAQPLTWTRFEIGSSATDVASTETCPNGSLSAQSIWDWLMDELTLGLHFSSKYSGFSGCILFYQFSALIHKSLTTWTVKFLEATLSKKYNVVTHLTDHKRKYARSSEKR